MASSPPDGVPVTVEADVAAPREHAFDVIVPVDLTLAFHRFGPLPAVTGTREQTGSWDHVGASRVVELSDGSEAPERIDTCERPERFGYTVGPFRRSPLGRLVSVAEGEWLFTEPSPGRTHIAWTYTFMPRTALGGAIVRTAIAPLWRRYAGRALGRLVELAERGSR